MKILDVATSYCSLHCKLSGKRLATPVGSVLNNSRKEETDCKS